MADRNPRALWINPSGPGFPVMDGEKQIAQRWSLSDAERTIARCAGKERVEYLLAQIWFLLGCPGFCGNTKNLETYEAMKKALADPLLEEIVS